MVEESPRRTKRLRRNLPSRSHEKLSPRENLSRHMSRVHDHNTNRELREQPHRLSERKSDQQHCNISERDRSMLKIHERRALRTRPQYLRDLRNRPQLRNRSSQELRARSEHKVELSYSLKERKERDRSELDSNVKTEIKNNSVIEEKDLKLSPCRLRGRPVTRLSNSCTEKSDKAKSKTNEIEDGNFSESEKAENNDNSDNDENEVNIFLTDNLNCIYCTQFDFFFFFFS